MTARELQRALARAARDIRDIRETVKLAGGWQYLDATDRLDVNQLALDGIGAFSQVAQEMEE